MCDAADKGTVSVSAFMSPREIKRADAYLRRHGRRFVAFGGYDGAERQRIYLLPEYMEGAEDVDGLRDFGFFHGVSAIAITPSGYRRLTHRDHLGAVLGLGIERSVVGDILVGEDGAAVVFCDATMAQFISSELREVANDKVKTRVSDVSDLTLPRRRFESISDTVASARVDCIVGALCSVSRERAKELVTGARVEIDYETEERPDRTVTAPALLSVRGFGKFRVLSVDGVTKKGRYRLIAEKFL